MSEKPGIYKSFLIRIWGDKTGSKRRVMVAPVAGSEQHYYFANLDDLMMFLLHEFEQTEKRGECL
jgi:hypothetical protein